MARDLMKFVLSVSTLLSPEKGFPSHFEALKQDNWLNVDVIKKEGFNFALALF